MKAYLLPIIALGFLTACAASPPGPTPIPFVPPVGYVAPPGSISLPAPSGNIITAKSVAAAGQSLTLAMEAATFYTDLPRCGSAGATVVCSELSIVRQIRLAAIKAHNLLIKARRNEAFLGGALSAITELQKIIPTS